MLTYLKFDLGEITEQLLCIPINPQYVHATISLLLAKDYTHPGCKVAVI